jgi:hypothetical protein
MTYVILYLPTAEYVSTCLWGEYSPMVYLSKSHAEITIKSYKIYYDGVNPPFLPRITTPDFLPVHKHLLEIIEVG